MGKLVLLLLLLTTPMFAQQSTEASSESTICFSESEWTEFEAQVQAELEKTALEAATEAVKPHLIYEEKLNADLRRITFSKNLWEGAAIGITITSVVLWILHLAKVIP